MCICVLLEELEFVLSFMYMYEIYVRSTQEKLVCFKVEEQVLALLPPALERCTRDVELTNGCVVRGAHSPITDSDQQEP